MHPQSNSSEYEKKLLIRMSQDDEYAFSELYILYKKRLFYFAQKLLKSKDYAEDVCQETFIVVWQNRHYIDINLSFSSYLYTITRNRILNLLRDTKKEEHLHDFIISQAIDYTADVNNAVSMKELKEIVTLALEKLTERQRQVFMMSREQGLSHKEIANALNISIYTVQEHLSSALKTIQRMINKHYGIYLPLFFIL